MKKIDSWAVAAAILLRSEYNMHYVKLAEAAVETGLTTLAEKGENPAQTLGSILRTKKMNGRAVFEAQGDGWYGLSDGEFVRSLSEVQEATRRLQESSSD